MARRLHVVATAAVVAGLLGGCGGAKNGDASPPAQAAAVTTDAPVTTASAAMFDASAVAGFPVRMQMRLPEGWRAQEGAPGTIDVVHVGNPPADTSQWWGANIAVVDGAAVHDPATVGVTERPPGRSDYVPWPKDYPAYVVSLPGVRVDRGPEAISVGGASGRRVVVDTPSMHPLVWMKDDTGPLGGGPSGVDPAMRRQIDLLDVAGRHVMIEYDDAPGSFAVRLPQLQALLDTITFPS